VGAVLVLPVRFITLVTFGLRSAPGSTPVSRSPVMAVEFGSFFDSMYSAAVAQMAANAGALVSDGQDLAGVLLLITLGWTIAIWMLSWTA
jgi:hypothetical protein